MTPEELEQSEAREKAATAGPWLYDLASNDVHSLIADTGQYTVIICGEHDREFHESSTGATVDLRFAANARQDIPALTAEVRRCWGEIERRNQDCMAAYAEIDRLRGLALDRENDRFVLHKMVRLDKTRIGDCELIHEQRVREIVGEGKSPNPKAGVEPRVITLPGGTFG